MSIDVAPYAAADQGAVVALILGIQRGELGVPITLADQPDLADVPGFYGRGRGSFWVAKEGGDVVGTIGLLDVGGSEAALRKMFVRSDRRGRGYGVAAALFDALLAHARANGFAAIALGTRPEMHAAHRFYEKQGFVRVAESQLSASFPKMTVDSVFYRVMLASGASGK